MQPPLRRQNSSCEFRQKVKGRRIVNDEVKPLKTGADLWLDPNDYRDDGYGLDLEPDAYKTQADGSVVFSTWDNPGEGAFRTLNLSLDFTGEIVDRSPSSPWYGKAVGFTKYYGFRVSGAAPHAKFTTIYGFDNASDYAPK